MAAEDDRDVLLAKGRSPAFDIALGQLLRAYDADVKRARLEPRANKHYDSVVATDTLRSSDAGVDAYGSRAPPSTEALLSPATRSAVCKHADAPIYEQPDVAVCGPFELGRGGAGKGSGEDDAEGHGGSESTDVLAAGADRPLTREEELPTYSSHDIQKHLRHLVPSNEGYSSLDKIARSAYFEAASAVILVLFCLLTALQMQEQGLSLGYELGWPNYGEPQATGWPEAGHVLSVLMVVCGIFFTVEMIFRIVATRLDFFRDRWNYLDVVILLCWVAEMAGTRSLGDLRAVRALRLLRLLRFFRLFRVLKQFESLFFLMQAMSGSLRILAWCSLMLFAVQTMTAFLIGQLLYTFYFPDKSSPLDERLKVFEYFGSFSRSLLTTFEMALGNWPVPARVLFENVSEWYVVFFLVHKMTVGFSVLGVINAVFVQETLQLATTDDLAMVIRKRRQARLCQDRLNRLFCAADGNQDGRLSLPEFKEILDHGDVRVWLSSMDFDCKDPDLLFELLDRDNVGFLSAPQFFEGMTNLKGHSRTMDLMLLVEEMRKLRSELGLEPTSERDQVSRRDSSALVTTAGRRLSAGYQ